MSATVLGTEKVQDLSVLAATTQDSVSKILGKNFCGESRFRIKSSDYANILSGIDDQSQQLRLQSTSDDEIGSYDVEIEFYLVDYPQVSTLTSFEIDIG